MYFDGIMLLSLPKCSSFTGLTWTMTSDTSVHYLYVLGRVLLLAKLESKNMIHNKNKYAED